MNDVIVLGQIDHVGNMFNDLFFNTDTNDQSNYYSVGNFNDKFSSNVYCIKNIRSFNWNYELFFLYPLHTYNAYNVHLFLVLTGTRFCCGEEDQAEEYVFWHNGKAILQRMQRVGFWIIVTPSLLSTN